MISPTPSPTKSSLRDSIGYWVGIAGAFLGILGIVLSVYFYEAARIEPALTYIVHPLRTELRSPDFDKDLHFTYRGKPVQSDSVTAVQVAIFNAGTRSIRGGSDPGILERIKLVTPDHAPILGIHIKKESRDICGFHYLEDANAQGAGSVSFDWTILEPGDGAVVQLIYAGDAETDPTLTGLIEGQPQIYQLHYRADPLEPGKDKLRALDEWFAVPNAIAAALMAQVEAPRAETAAARAARTAVPTTPRAAAGNALQRRATRTTAAAVASPAT